MAKMFYTLDETKVALGKNEEEIKQFTREGKLREFRDGPRLMFKADQVDSLRNSIGGGDVVNLGGESGSPINLADTKGGSGISLADTGAGSGLGSGVAAGGGASAGSGMMNLKDDTALAADLGLSGSMGGVPSPSRAASGTGLSGTSQGSRVGINVFGEESEKIDPMAQTSMSSGITSGGSAADLSLDAVGSGSGLLDLTRESDDTSLGAELLDEIAPGSRRDTSGAAIEELDEPRGGVVRGGGPIYVEADDPMAPAFGGAALGAAAVIIFGLFALLASVSGAWPDMIKGIHDKGWNLWTIAAIALAVPVVTFFGGLVAGKVAR